VKTFGPACSVDAEVIAMTGPQKTAIVKTHNTKRNLLASGKLSGFPKATQMPQLVGKLIIDTSQPYHFKIFSNGTLIWPSWPS
jgi:hypothetical protein